MATVDGLRGALLQRDRHLPARRVIWPAGQIRRAAVSIPSNIAEGYCRRKPKPYAHHVSISLGSHAEVETCLELARRLGYIPPKLHEALGHDVELIGRILSGLHRSLEDKIAREEAMPSRRRSPGN